MADGKGKSGMRIQNNSDEARQLPANHFNTLRTPLQRSYCDAALLHVLSSLGRKGTKKCKRRPLVPGFYCDFPNSSLQKRPARSCASRHAAPAAILCRAARRHSPCPPRRPAGPPGIRADPPRQPCGPPEFRADPHGVPADYTASFTGRNPQYSSAASKHGHSFSRSQESTRPFPFTSGDMSRCPRIAAAG